MAEGAAQSLNPYIDRAVRSPYPENAWLVGSAADIERVFRSESATIVKNSFARWLSTVGSCEECGATRQLQRAHRQDCARPKLVREAAERAGRVGADGMLTVGVKALRVAFLELHRDDAQGRRLRCLCRTCHRAYDRASAAPSAAPPA